MNKKAIILVGITAIVSLLVYFGISSPCAFAKCKVESNELFSTQNTQRIVSLSVYDFKTTLESNDTILLDVRTSEEFATGKIEGATQIDFYQTPSFRSSLSEMDRAKQYLVYCRSGNRSGQTLALMKELGFENVSDLRGGITAWINAGYDILE